MARIVKLVYYRLVEQFFTSHTHVLTVQTIREALNRIEMIDIRTQQGKITASQNKPYLYEISETANRQIFPCSRRNF